MFNPHTAPVSFCLIGSSPVIESTNGTMVHQPSVIFIVRHGTRLDAVDQTWHRTAKDPYDPPLTYGGWNQARSLGVRIARLVRAREKELAQTSPHSEPTGDTPPAGDTLDERLAYASLDDATPTILRPRDRLTPSRPMNVYIHTSPYQRCVQTAVAISASLVEYNGLTAARRTPSTESRDPLDTHSASPKSFPVDSQSSSTPSPPPLDPFQALPLPQPDLHPSSSSPPPQPPLLPPRQKPILRVDASLGEWLSPEYSDLPQRPPESVHLVATAKAELSRPCDTIESFLPAASATHGSLWSSTSSSFAETALNPENRLSDRPSNGVRSLSSVFTGTVPSAWSSDLDSPHNNVRHVSNPNPHLTNHSASGYQPPLPAYAILPTEPIPKGYFAHARDACADVDFEWDSQLAPLYWGDGGEYTEEWSSLHKRFRSTLGNLVNWYDDENAEEAFSSSHKRLYGHDDTTDSAIIIVTHSAGCNALIAALTESPVLLDVGVASLSMAVRKDTTSPSKVPTLDSSLASAYEMKLIASVQHLRTTMLSANAPTTASLYSTMTGPSASSGLGRRNTVLTSTLSSSMPEEHWIDRVPKRRSNSGGSRRPCVSPTLSLRSDSMTSMSSAIGLWTPIGRPYQTLDFDERLNASQPFHNSPLSELPIKEDDLDAAVSQSITTDSPERLASSVASDATIVGNRIVTSSAFVDRINTSLPDRASSASPKSGTLSTPSPLIEAIIAAQTDDGTSTIPPPGLLSTAAPPVLSRTLDGHASDRTHDVFPTNNAMNDNNDPTNTTSSRSDAVLARTVSRPRPIPTQGLQRVVSQKGLWGSEPANILEHRQRGLPSKQP